MCSKCRMYKGTYRIWCFKWTQCGKWWLSNQSYFWNFAARFELSQLFIAFSLFHQLSPRFPCLSLFKFIAPNVLRYPDPTYFYKLWFSKCLKDQIKGDLSRLHMLLALIFIHSTFCNCVVHTSSSRIAHIHQVRILTATSLARCFWFFISPQLLEFNDRCYLLISFREIDENAIFLYAFPWR